MLAGALLHGVAQGAGSGASEEEMMDWHLKLEGIAREIDAGFSPDTMPADLAALRERIVTIAGGEPGGVMSAPPQPTGQSV